MKVKSIKKKIAAIGVTLTSFVLLGTQKVFADPQSALVQAKGNVDGQVRPIVNNVIVPVIDLVLVVLLVMAIVKAVASYRHGREIELSWILIIAVAVTLVTTFPAWGWAMIG